MPCLAAASGGQVWPDQARFVLPPTVPPALPPPRHRAWQCCPNGPPCGRVQIRIVNVGVDLAEVPSEAMTLPPSEAAGALQWSPRGQILAAATDSGTIHCFLGVVPLVHAVFRSSVAHMTSLNECAVQRFPAADAPPVAVPVSVTPHLLAVCSDYVITVLNNRVLFHRLEAPSEPPRAREYPGSSVEAVQASDTHLALLMDGRVIVHGLEHETEKMMPYRDQDVTDFALTEHFLIIGTAKGQLQHYSVAPGAIPQLLVLSLRCSFCLRGGTALHEAAPGKSCVVLCAHRSLSFHRHHGEAAAALLRGPGYDPAPGRLAHRRFVCRSFCFPVLSAQWQCLATSNCFLLPYHR